MRRDQKPLSATFQARGDLIADVTDQALGWEAVVTFQAAGPGSTRLVVHRVELEAWEHHSIDVATWRAFPLTQVETWANLPAVAQALRADIEPNAYDAMTPEELKAATVKPPRKVPARLLRPPSTFHYSDSFYQRVADAYRYYAWHRMGPAVSIAADAGVKVSTVHRWTGEARKRGLLAPARAKGRIG